MNTHKQLLLILVLACYASFNAGGIGSSALSVAQKSAGIVVVGLTLNTLHNNVSGIPIHHLAPLTGPSLATGLNLIFRKRLLPEGEESNVDSGITLLRGCLTIGMIKRSLDRRPLRYYNLSRRESQFDAIILGAAVGQALDCSYKLYKKLQAWKNSRNSAQEAPLTSSL